MMGIKQFGMLVLTLVIGVSTAQAADSDAAEKLAAELKGYTTYQADFIQIVVDGNGSEVQESRGSLKAKRPGLFYWETDRPMAQFIASNDEKVEVYDPDLEQVTIHALDQQVANTPAMLLSGEVGNLSENYEVSVRAIGENSNTYTLIPTSQDSLFVSLDMTFYDGKLEEMRLEDSLGQRSILSFNNIVLNDEIADSDFVLDYPDNVDVIQGES
ncbi:outer membrane lipoprotein chaperone LolA [Marinobacter changyiensis]|uniref:outer membrane lipoprotein chaperone LolA n=1 Tax=Marinobacter changyiensis TaxID=2604091 RepID=UPI001264AAEE